MRPGPDRGRRRAESAARWTGRRRGASGSRTRSGASAWALVPLLLLSASTLPAAAPAAPIDAATRAEIVARTVRYMVAKHPQVAAARELCLELPGEDAATVERALSALGDLAQPERALRSGAPCPQPPPAESLRVVLELVPIRELADRMDVAASVSGPDGERGRFVYYLVVVAGEWTVTGYLEPYRPAE